MFRETLRNFIENKNWCFFAINNACNNRCETCSIWEGKHKFVRYKDAKNVLDKLYKNNFGIIQLTGGEPLLNPDFFNIVKYAKKLNFFVFVPTNGTLINEKIADKLKESKIDQISISIQHFIPEKIEKITGHKGILNKINNSIELLKKRKIPVSALCTILNDNLDYIEDIVELIDERDITISFCMPVTIENTSFRLGNNGNSVVLDKNDLKNALIKIINLKKQGYNIANSMDYLRDTIRYLDGKNRYNCCGGKKLFYIDWNLNVYPCMYKGNPTNIKYFNFENYNGEECNECMIQCFREPSIISERRTRALKIFAKNIPFIILMCAKRAKTILK